MSFSSNRRQPEPGGDVSPFGAAFLLALFVFEAAALSSSLAVHRYYNLLGNLTMRQGTVIGVSIAVCVAAGVFAAGRVVRLRREHRRQAMFAFGLNAVAILLVFAATEAAVRALSRPTPFGRAFGDVVLLPRSWDEVRARYSRILADLPPDLSYIVADDLIGWAPARSRRSADGLYSSSVEGARSAAPGTAIASRNSQQRVVLVGDSFTFGLEVPFESAWGTVLEGMLGPDAAVVNLGVDGYGVDQALLRYERDGRPWKPDVAILGFIDHDLLRTLSVYTFVTFPEWGFPFAKSRFVVNDGALARLTDRLESPAGIMRETAIDRLPLIDRDPGYDREEWERRFYHASFAVRLLLSRYRRWPRADDEARDTEIAQLNAALLSRFVTTAQQDGTRPIVVFLPARSDYAEGSRRMRDATLAALGSGGVEYVDLRSCVAALGVERAFLPNRPHYSPEGNAAVARCLLPAVRAALVRP